MPLHYLDLLLLVLVQQLLVGGGGMAVKGKNGNLFHWVFHGFGWHVHTGLKGTSAQFKSLLSSNRLWESYSEECEISWIPSGCCIGLLRLCTFAQWLSLQRPQSLQTCQVHVRLIEFMPLVHSKHVSRLITVCCCFLVLVRVKSYFHREMEIGNIFIFIQSDWLIIVIINAVYVFF